MGMDIAAVLFGIIMINLRNRRLGENKRDCVTHSDNY